ncbi:malto-oligosyltrehalose synthase [Microvirga solisilvae]|uniref:malto-oligosyltrehalose synthase n=1 Tax=Microvirga solisilvae TaxID=2919498 RepID=UPI001FAF72C8|nr:malto-oligosyltrehalose synthase [Microvirga solisilvae]
MSRLEALLENLSEAIGISSDYSDAFGRNIKTTPETRRALLEALGLNISTEEAAQQSLSRLKKLKAGLIPAVISILADRPTLIPLRGKPPQGHWSITQESGEALEGRVAENDNALSIPALPMGYHSLNLDGFEATIIAAPEQCWQPEALNDHRRLWGATAQIYSLRSAHDLGIGDYTDVADLARSIAALGGAFLGLSPAHALFAADRTKISPYSPSSRLFLESLYIDPTAVDGFAESGAKQTLERQDVQDHISRLQGAQLIDYGQAWCIKRSLLDAVWKHFQVSGDRSAFVAFQRGGGKALEAHATFEALSEHFSAQGLAWIGEWPQAFRDASSVDVERFRSEHEERIEFHAWLQWIADKQLAQAADHARAAGLTIGLYRDLAVGADGGGSEIWATPERYAAGLSIGAPPDPLGPQGQNWGLPPFNPLALEEQGLAAFRDLVSANMRHAGAIRIDHAFQLQRLFLIPSGAAASQGAYVDYPFEAMLAVLRVESHRARCLVIAEDLGTAPKGFSDAIMQSGVLSYRVLPFEREGAGFKEPQAYPRPALSVLTTHDLPTFIGWWRGLDIDLRQTLGIFDPETAEREREAREADKRHFAASLAKEGLLPSSQVPHSPPLEPAIRYLARTSCVLTSLQIEDASGELNQPNMPGMDVGHPNWRRRLSRTTESIAAPGGLLAKLSAALTEEGRDARDRKSALASPPPRATYRLQFHKGFTFDDTVKIVPYLASLGISHVYSSPIHAASPGSTHGYDIVDHYVINSELGGEEGFRRFSDALKEHGLKLILDIVPNHMGVGGQANAWWLSALEWGRLSPTVDAFDIDWERPGANGKLLIPILGNVYGETLEKGELELKFDEREGSFSVWHWEHRLPICPATYPLVLAPVLAAVEDGVKTNDLLSVTERLAALSEPHIKSPVEEGERLKEDLARIVANHPMIGEAISRTLKNINGIKGSPESFNALHRLLEAQSYRLAYWRAASSDINYRRFFDINSLAGIRVDIPEVFERTHELIFRLVDENRIHGLRIDHIDGLADPEGYVQALQGKLGPGFYIVVEKILEPGEDLRPWPVAGTTGYDTLNLIDGVLVDQEAAKTFERIYQEASGFSEDYDSLLKQAKIEITQNNFASELDAITSDIKTIADASHHTRDYTNHALRRALVEIIAAFPVYRSYLTDSAPSPEDERLITGAIAAAKRSSLLPDRSAHDFVGSVLLGKARIAKLGDIRRFRQRFQQLSGPVMAKSLEDTLFYRYGRLIALNEVGGDPGHFGITIQDFHEANIQRARNWPYSMLATATHDTKRGEDARARLLALSEMPDDCEATIRMWREMISPHLSDMGGSPAPDANDQVILLQALLGAWPLELLDANDKEETASFHERMKGYVTKALREAKRQTSWVSPNDEYERSALKILQAALDPKNGIIERLRPLALRLSALGMLNGLSRTILKMTLPGVPDIYQGTEFWDFSLVDPDNRRPVDYEARSKALAEGKPSKNFLENWRSGSTKQHFITTLLKDRAGSSDLYADGDYQPLPVIGEGAAHVIAFLREHGDERLAVIVPRLWNGLIDIEELRFQHHFWKDTIIALPAGQWTNVITGELLSLDDGERSLSGILSPFPFAVLRQKSKTGRL